MTIVRVFVAVNFLRLGRDRIGLFFVVILPVLIIVIIGTAFGADRTEAHVGVIDGDRSDVSARVVAAVDRSPALRVEPYSDEGALRRDVRTGQVDGGLVIPAGTAADVEAGETVSLPLVADLAGAATPALQSALQSALTAEGEQLTAAQVLAAQGVDNDDALDALDAVEPTVEPSTVSEQTVGSGTSLFSTNRFAYTAPSNLVLFVFVNSLASAAALVEARRLGIMRRVLAAPVTTASVVLGIGLSRFLFVLFQAVVIVVIGAAVFGVDWGNAPAVVALVMMWGLVATGAGLVLGAFARDPEQPQSFGVPLSISMAMLGGCMWPLEIVPETVRVIGHVFPHAWAMDAFIELVFDHVGLREILPQLGVLAVFALVFMAAGSWALRRSLTGAAAN